MCQIVAVILGIVEGLYLLFGLLPISGNNWFLFLVAGILSILATCVPIFCIGEIKDKLNNIEAKINMMTNDNPNANNTKTKNQKSSTTYNSNSKSSYNTKPTKDSTTAPSSDKWTCKNCGKANYLYVTTCKCGQPFEDQSEN